MPGSTSTPQLPATRIYRSHYGIVAESKHDGYLFTTMRRHNGYLATSLSRITKDADGVLISEPIADAIKWSEEIIKPLTGSKLAAFHELRVQMFLLEIEIANLPS